MKKLIMVLVISILTAGALCAQQLNLDETLTRAARGVEEVLSQGTKAAVLNFASPSETFSNFVIEELTGKLVMGRKVTIVDRQNLSLVTQEMNLQTSGNVSDESAQAIGRLLGAQSIVSGSLTNMGSFYRFRVRVINVETAAIQTQVSLDLRNDAQVAYLLGGDSKSASARVSRNNEDERFDLDNKKVFAVGVYPWIGTGYGAGLTITVFERHFSGGAVPGISVFIDGIFHNQSGNFIKNDGIRYTGAVFGPGVLLRWRPGHQNRFLLNLGISWENFIGRTYLGWYYDREYYDGEYYDGYSGTWVSGMGVKGGLSYRLGRNAALDLNGILKFSFWSPFDDYSYTHFIVGAALGFTFMLPY